ncbi:MAG: SGNH/GDSL hydrolase family protein [Gammaproteobacteria bacterium]
MLKKISQSVRRVSANITLLASTLILSCGLANTAQAIPYSQISQVYFFGDSLTDSGFNDLWSFPTPLPTGKAPTFTTFGGYTWAQYVARDIKGFVLPVYPGPNPPDTITNNSIYPVPGFVSGTLRGVDYAAAGSTTNSTGFNETWAPSLLQQVSYYLSTTHQVADPNAVYFLWSGANNILKLLTSSPLPNQLQLLTAASAAANDIANAVTLLSRSGAKRVVVLALPNIGYTPLINQIAIAQNIPTLPASMQTLCFSFNSMLNTALGYVIAKYGIKVLYVDVYNLLDQVILATKAGRPYSVGGQSFQFVNYTTPACSTVSSAIYCPSTAPNNYVFADVLHPTDMAHRVLSLFVETQIQGWK